MGLNLLKIEAFVTLGIRARKAEFVPPPNFPFILAQFSIRIRSFLIKDSMNNKS